MRMENGETHATTPERDRELGLLMVFVTEAKQGSY